MDSDGDLSTYRPWQCIGRRSLPGASRLGAGQGWISSGASTWRVPARPYRNPPSRTSRPPWKSWTSSAFRMDGTFSVGNCRAERGRGGDAMSADVREKSVRPFERRGRTPHLNVDDGSNDGGCEWMQRCVVSVQVSCLAGRRFRLEPALGGSRQTRPGPRSWREGERTDLADLALLWCLGSVRAGCVCVCARVRACTCMCA